MVDFCAALLQNWSEVFRLARLFANIQAVADPGGCAVAPVDRNVNKWPVCESLRADFGQQGQREVLLRTAQGIGT